MQGNVQKQMHKKHGSKRYNMLKLDEIETPSNPQLRLESEMLKCSKWNWLKWNI